MGLIPISCAPRQSRTMLRREPSGTLRGQRCRTSTNRILSPANRETAELTIGFRRQGPINGGREPVITWELTRMIARRAEVAGRPYA